MLFVVKRTLYLLAYYGFARYLPDTSFPGGELATKLRGFLCAGFIGSAGTPFYVRSGTFLADGRYLHVGNSVSIGPGCRIYGAQLGDCVIVGPGCVFFKENRGADDLDKPVGAHDTTPINVPVVEDWAWVGERAIVLQGRRIGRGAIVGAGAVVTRDVEPFTVVGGNPARVIGHRGRDSRLDASQSDQRSL
jgi:maltose O-acetyltransferase